MIIHDRNQLKRPFVDDLKRNEKINDSIGLNAKRANEKRPAFGQWRNLKTYSVNQAGLTKLFYKFVSFHR